MRVLVTGGTGFFGSYLVPQLIEDGHAVTCLVRDEKSRDVLPDGVGIHKGDVLKPETLSGMFDDIDAAIHLVGIIEEKKSAGITFERLHVDATRNVAEAAASAGVSRFILMSANGARENGVSPYQTTKWRAEQIIKNGNFESWTIFRPSFLFGDPGNDNPEFVTQIANSLIVPFPILPVFGSGDYKLQPVAVEDVALAFSSALVNEAARNRSYIAVGKESFRYTEILDIITRSCGLTEKKKIHQPIFLARIAVNTIGRIGLLPISPDQFEMLIEGNSGNPTAFHNDFNLDGIPFSVDNLQYVQKYISK
ncbi:MAG: NAD(P)H-binding protein [Rhodothermales bacterium]|nr:NAD(P)H-binding protein [Rhodothermales bacterium]